MDDASVMRRDLILRFCWYTLGNLMDLLSDDDPVMELLQSAREKMFMERTKLPRYSPDEWTKVGKKGLWS
jgi:hypothetical protein